jgi:hypothetical protein
VTEDSIMLARHGEGSPHLLGSLMSTKPFGWTAALRA